jgi:hypothetical protein
MVVRRDGEEFRSARAPFDERDPNAGVTEIHTER